MAGDPRSGLWGDLALQLLLGVAMGAVHLALSLEIAITASPYRALVRTLILLLYPAALALTGLGALLLHRWPGLGGDGGLRGAGLLLLAFLAWCLWGPQGAEGGVLLVGLALPVLLTLGGWYLLLGAAVAASLLRLRRQDRVSLGWALHLAGLMLGYGLSEALAVQIGANAVVALTGLSLLAGARHALPVWASLQVLGLWLPIDAGLEDLRTLDGLMPDLPETYALDGGERRIGTIEDTVWMGWSRRSQARLVSLSQFEGDRKQFRMLYNFTNQYRVDPRAFSPGPDENSGQRRTGIYQVLDGAQRVIVIGAGAGRGLLSLPVTLDERVHAVERNPAAVRLFRDLAPELNGGLYSRVSVHAADGRTVLERLPSGWGGIVVESSLYSPAHLLLPASAPYFHQTQEAFALMTERLDPGGVLIVEYNRAGKNGPRREMAWRAWTGLKALGLEVRVLSSGLLQNLYVMACKQPGCGDRLIAEIPLRDDDEWLQQGPKRVLDPLTDDRPFTAWEKLEAGDRVLLRGVAALLVLAALGLAWRERARATAPDAWRGAALFVLGVGVGHIALQLHAFHLARTYFQDSVRTVLVMIVLFLGWGVVGSALLDRLPRAWLRSGRWLVAAAALLALHGLLLSHLPFHRDEAWIRGLAALVATLPGGVLMGALLPVGLRRAAPAQLPGLVAVDAAGTLAGYALIYPVMLPHGAAAFGVVAVGAYLMAAALVARA